MKVLVTGSKGFIGRHVVSALYVAGHEPVEFDRPGCDVMNASQLAMAIRGRDAEGVINLAGWLGTAELLGAEFRATQVNVLGALNVYDAARVARIPVVQIGTGHKGQPNPYAITKGCAEDLGLSRAQWLGERIAVVRAYHVYGDGQKPPPPYGPAPVRKLIPSIGCQAIAGDPMEIYGSGEQEIDLVHVQDVAHVLVEALAGPYGEVTEAGTGKACTPNQAAVAVLNELGLEFGGPVKHLPMRPGEPGRSRVVATEPACRNLWPYKLGETLDWLHQFVPRKVSASG